ncbi:MAG TPA: cobyric acid synthase, partial [Caldanaerobacter subterraneus]
MLENIIQKEVLGVIPYMDVKIDEEDSVTESFSHGKEEGEVDIAVLKLPHISNFTDFDPLTKVPGIRLRYINRGERIGDCDVLIIPGTKNTIGDLKVLKDYGLDKEILNLREKGKFIIGICGGFQMLGKVIKDPYHVEGEIEEIEGLGLLDVETVIEKEKITSDTLAFIKEELPDILSPLKGLSITGYEIHMGKSRILGENKHFSDIILRNKEKVRELDGAVSKDGKVFGTYIHGIFENSVFTKEFINIVRREKGLAPLEEVINYREFREKEYDRLADIVRNSLDMDRIYQIMERYRDR